MRSLSTPASAAPTSPAFISADSHDERDGLKVPSAAALAAMLVTDGASGPARPARSSCNTDMIHQDPPDNA
jgi:hypothetical protein